MGASPTLNQLAARLAAGAAPPDEPTPDPEDPPIPLDMPRNLLDLAAALAGMRQGETLTLAQGIYELPNRLTTFGTTGTTVKAANGARVVVTTVEGSPPSVLVPGNATLRGLWIGGVYDTTDNPVQMGSNATVEGNTFFGYRQCVIEGSGNNNQYLRNRFIRCGDPSMQHALYISGDEVDLSKDALVDGNVFVGCDSYCLHLWHMPSDVTMRNNFMARSRWLLVDQGYRHVVEDNIFWSHYGFLCNAAGKSTTFVHNLIGYNTTIWGRWTDAVTMRSNQYLHGFAHPQDSAPVLLSLSDVPRLLGCTYGDVEAALDAVDRAFKTIDTALYEDGRVDAALAFLDSLTQWA